MLSGQFVGALNASIDVIALLKVDLLKEIPVGIRGWNRVPEHLDSWQMWDCALHWFQSFTKIIVESRRDGCVVIEIH